MKGFKDTTRVQYYAGGGSVKGPKGAAKVSKVMGEFKSGKLHSGSKSGPEVTNRKQAVAIALSEARKATKKCEGGSVKYAKGGAVKDPNAAPAAYARSADNERIREVKKLAKGGSVKPEGKEKALLKVKGPLGDKLRSIEAEEQGVMRKMGAKPVKKGIGGIIKKISPLAAAVSGENPLKALGNSLIPGGVVTDLLRRKKPQAPAAPAAPSTPQPYAKGGAARKRRAPPVAAAGPDLAVQPRMQQPVPQMQQQPSQPQPQPQMQQPAPQPQQPAPPPQGLTPPPGGMPAPPPPGLNAPPGGLPSLASILPQPPAGGMPAPPPMPQGQPTPQAMARGGSMTVKRRGVPAHSGRPLFGR